MKVFAYIRKSTNDTRIQQNSLQYQKNDISARFSEYDNIEFFEHSESASKKGREGFKSLLKEIRKCINKKEKVVLLAHNVDRLTRNLHDLATLDDMRRKGVLIRTLAGDMTGTMGMMNMGIQAIFATNYIDEMKRKQESAFLKLLKEGKSVFGVAKGYKAGKIKGIREPHPQKKHGVIELFQKFLEYDGGVTPFLATARNIFKKYNMSINTKDGLKKILTNRFYIGEISYKPKNSDTVFKQKGQHKTFIDINIFNQVQKKINSRKKVLSVKHNPPFKGRITCKCDTPLYAELQKGNYYYRCQKKDCDFKSITEKNLNNNISEFLKKIEFSASGAKIIKKIFLEQKKNINKHSKADRIFLQKKISELEKKSEKLLEMRINEELTKERFYNEDKKLQEEINEYYEQFSNIKKEKIPEKYKVFNFFLELVESKVLCWDSSDREKQGLIAQLLFSNLYINKENALIIGVYDFVNFKKSVNSKLVARSRLELLLPG